MGLKIHRRRRQHARPNNIVCVDATKTKSKKLKNERKKCFSFLCCVGLMDVSCVRLLVMLAAACKLGFSWNVENKIAIKRMGELRLARKNAKKQKREDFFLRCGETHDACWHRWTQLHNKQMKTLGVPTEDQQWSRFVQSLLRDENLICIIKTLSKRKHKTMFSKRDNNRWGRGKQSNFLWLRSEPMRLTDVARLLFCFFFSFESCCFNTNPSWRVRVFVFFLIIGFLWLWQSMTLRWVCVWWRQAMDVVVFEFVDDMTQVDVHSPIGGFCVFCSFCFFVLGVVFLSVRLCFCFSCFGIWFFLRVVAWIAESCVCVRLVWAVRNAAFFFPFIFFYFFAITFAASVFSLRACMKKLNGFFLCFAWVIPTLGVCVMSRSQHNKTTKQQKKKQ